MIRTLLLALILSLAAHAEEESYEYVRPVIGDSVVRRHQENVRTIDLNIHSIQESIKNADKNIKTLDEEIARLDQIVEEHVELKKRYENYLTSADAEMKKFAETHQARDTASKTPESPAQQDAAAWTEDAKTKVEKVKQYLVKAEANLAEAKANRDKNAATLEQVKNKKIKMMRDLEGAMQKRNALQTAVRESMTKRVTTSIRYPQSK